MQSFCLGRKSLNPFSSKTAIVTGGGSGRGREIRLSFSFPGFLPFPVSS